MQLQESMDVPSVRKLSSVLTKPHKLSAILQQVGLQLPAGLSMLTGLTVEETYVSHTVATVHGVATSKNIRLFVDVSPKAADRYFEQYQVYYLPFFYKVINSWL
jgi:hypothetical protein